MNLKYLLWNVKLAGWHRAAQDGIEQITSHLDLAGRFGVKEAVAFRAENPGTVAFPDVEGKLAELMPGEYEKLLLPCVTMPVGEYRALVASGSKFPGQVGLDENGEVTTEGWVTVQEHERLLKVCAEMRHSLVGEGWTQEALQRAFGEVGAPREFKVEGLEVASAPDTAAINRAMTTVLPFAEAISVFVANVETLSRARASHFKREDDDACKWDSAKAALEWLLQKS